MNSFTTIILTLLNKSPEIITAIGVLVTILITYSNNTKADIIKEGVTQVKSSAEDAAIKAHEASKLAAEAAVKTDKIEQQTNSHLTTLLNKIEKMGIVNENLQQTINTLTNLLATLSASAGTSKASQITITPVNEKDLKQVATTIADMVATDSDKK